LQKFLSILGVLLILGCDPFVTEFEDLSDAVMYEANSKSNATYDSGNVKVVTWNIRFGIARFPFFGDSCGDDVILDDATIEENMAAIADALNAIDADIVLVQEVDVSSKRTGYMDQVQYLLDNTNLNYGCYASMWKADYIPSDGFGRIDAGNAILSKYELTDAERIQLRLRTDQDGLTQYFYLRRNIVKAKIPALTQGPKDFYAVDIHATAFATDDTKQQHIKKYVETLAEIESSGDYFVTGGDLNSVPPGSITDFCESDMCEGEDYHTAEAEEYHKEGSYFENFELEPDILLPLYDVYNSAIDSASYNLPEHFTHAPSTSMIDDTTVTMYDRKLDYLFTNGVWENTSSITHQADWELSDHLPVSAVLDLGGE
jgi:endonuclease/exonuclease/phosphatase family metal-dependent hydrolase